MLRALYQSPALRAAVGFGFGGIAFTVGNLILARVMSAYEYGVLSLLVGILAVAALCAPLGLDYVLARRGYPMGASLRRIALGAAAVVGLITALVTGTLYRLAPPLLIAAFLTTVGTGVAQSVAAHFQGQRQFSLALPFTQLSSWSLLGVGALAWILTVTTATLPMVLIAAAALAAGAIGWRMVAARTRGIDPKLAVTTLLSEAISLMTINVAGAVLLQLERLIIPMTIGVEKVALFGVAASLVGSPFRMLYSAVHFTVIPRLRDAKTLAERRRLLRREVMLFTVVMLPTSLGLWLLAGPIAHWFLRGRYDLTDAIIAAMIVSGILKLMSAFGTAIVSALAPERGLWLLSTSSWICIALSIGAAFLLRSWGVTGAIYAVSIGWFGRTLAALWIAVPHLQQPPEAVAQ
jgi:O-antigen/teichoic acid export membrane protein